MESSATGTRGTLTMPHSMASTSEKSLTTQGNSVPSRVARAAQEERRRREVVDGADADLALDRLEAADPDAGLFVALLGLFALVALERSAAGFLAVLRRLAAVAVVGLVVDDDDVALAAELPADAAHHLVGRLGEGALRGRAAAGEELLGQLCRP